MRNGSKSRCTVFVAILIFLGSWHGSPPLIHAQTVSGNGAGSGVSGGGFRPFVTGVVPVVGPNGGVGGVMVDAEGVVQRATSEQTRRLQTLRQQAIAATDVNVSKDSEMRKVSLRKLEAAIGNLRDQGKKLTPEIELLAGLQRIEYVFVDPEKNDIILAGPAGGWKVGKDGQYVGASSNSPVLQLCDLIVAMRLRAEDLGGGITCSMDATDEGLRAYSNYMKTRPTINKRTLENCREAIGPFKISLTGVPNDSRFARILVAADLVMKRIGMNLERSPVKKLKSYVQMLSDSKRVPNNAMPRWWLAVNYEPILKDVDGLAWQIRGQGVRMMSEDEFFDGKSRQKSDQGDNSLAQNWADSFTEQFINLCKEIPVFAELRNCMDWCVFAALVEKYRLFERAGFESQILIDPKQIELAKHHVPQRTAAHVTANRKGRSWLLSISGGVEIDGWSVASNVAVTDTLDAIRQQSVDAIETERWWWD